MQTLLVLLAIICLTFLWRSWRSLKSAAPGPLPLPIIGHLHLLLRESAPHILFIQLAQKYGPIVSLRLGSIPVVVASTKEAAKQFLKDKDAVFCSRPSTPVGRILHNNQDMTFAPYGKRWRQLHKMCTLNLFTVRRVASFNSIRMEEIRSMLSFLHEAASSNAIVDMRGCFVTLGFNSICRILMGKSYYATGQTEDIKEAAEFIKLFDEIVDLMGKFPIGEYFPALRWLDQTEIRFKRVSTSIHALLERIVREHEQSLQKPDKGIDFIHLMLEQRDQGEECFQSRHCIKSFLMDLLGAGSETTSVTLEWALAELIKQPPLMKKLQEEIAKAVRNKGIIEEIDIEKIEYLHAVVKETFRLHPPVALLLPHYSMDACNVLGYEIPKGTTVYVNVYAIGRDPSLWEDPTEFKPERFVNSNVDVIGQDFELLPFGAGRRICPGKTMALSLIGLALANLVHSFNWEMPPGMEVDTVNEKYGVTLLMANKLQALVHPRFHPELVA